MLRINKKVEYALMALKFMASKKDGELTSAREICDEFRTPFDTVAKVLQSLNLHEILNSVKGVNGGYTLSRPLNEITFMELSRIIEGSPRGKNCLAEKGTCELYGSCNIVTPIEQLRTKIEGYLERLTLEELLVIQRGKDAHL